MYFVFHLCCVFVKDLAALEKDYEGAGMDLFEEEGEGQKSSVGMVILNCY
jgi:hypothetical protein